MVSGITTKMICTMIGVSEMMDNFKWYSMLLFATGLNFNSAIESLKDGDYTFMVIEMILFLCSCIVVPKMYRDLQQELVTKQSNTADEK